MRDLRSVEVRVKQEMKIDLVALEIMDRGEGGLE